MKSEKDQDARFSRERPFEVLADSIKQFFLGGPIVRCFPDRRNEGAFN